MSVHRFQSEGALEWMRSPEYRRLAREAEARVRERFAARLAAARLLARVWLTILRARAIRREIDALAPFEANWF